MPLRKLKSKYYLNKKLKKKKMFTQRKRKPNERKHIRKTC